MLQSVLFQITHCYPLGCLSIKLIKGYEYIVLDGGVNQNL